jgi:hypothetical protein
MSSRDRTLIRAGNEVDRAQGASAAIGGIRYRKTQSIT